jgi:co-chaperonin GroES (HSP10)
MNQSGITPKGNRVLVLPDEIDEKVSEGGIFIPQQVRDQHAMSQTTGVFIAAGPDAWTHSIQIKYRMIDGAWKPAEKTVTGYSEPFAKPGERVVFAKFGGLDVKGVDGKKYRILNDEDITTGATEEVEFTDLKSRKALGASHV